MSAWNEERHKAARKAIASFWYATGVPFNVAQSPYWQAVIDAITDCNSGFRPPSCDDLKGPLLRESMQDIQLLVEQQRDIWKVNGCTIMLDGWMDGRSRMLLNFLVASSDGIIFLKSVDASAHVKNSKLLAQMLGDVVEEVGAENVVQVITDNTLTYVAAGRLLEERFPTLIWTSCASHCLDLLLEDLEKLPWVVEVVQKAKAITKYIYDHTWVLNLMWQYNDDKEIVQPDMTRFATNFITLQSLFSAQGALKKMFVGDEWITENGAKYRNTTEWKKVYDIIFEDTLWMAMDEAIKVSKSLVRVLRLVDREKSPMGYVYEAMNRAKEAITSYYEYRPQKYKPIWDIIDRHWIGQFHSPLHAAAYFLNPQFFLGTKIYTDYEVMSGLRICIDRLVADPKVRSEIQSELQAYKKGEGILLKSPECNKQRSILLPYLWWEDFGSYTPNLQRFAIRILSQPCSASGCERNWRVFEYIHSKKRNKLIQKKLNDLAYVHYNLLVRQRQMTGSSYEAIDLDQIDPSFEWIIEEVEQHLEDPPFNLQQLQDLEELVARR